MEALRIISPANVMMLDLTSAFGAGNEPDLETIRQLVVSAGGFWNADKTIQL